MYVCEAYANKLLFSLCDVSFARLIYETPTKEPKREKSFAFLSDTESYLENT